MPKYSVLEVCLEDKIDFENKETMTAAIIDKSIFFALEVQRYIENIKWEISCLWWGHKRNLVLLLRKKP